MGPLDLLNGPIKGIHALKNCQLDSSADGSTSKIYSDFNLLVAAALFFLFLFEGCFVLSE